MLKYFDGHCDSIYIAYDQQIDLNHNDMFVSIENRRKFEKFCQVFAIWMMDDVVGQQAIDYIQNVYDYACQQEAKYSDHFKICRTKKDYEEAILQDKLCGVMMLEGANALGGRLDQVKHLYDLGFRMMTMTWNNENEVGFGCNADATAGLKPFGKEVLQEMKKCGMVCDVSHLNDAGFADAAESGCLMIATHSDSRTVCDNPRNITDEQFKHLLKMGTGVGISLFPPFIGPNKSIAELVTHIEHFLSLGGEDHVFIGADFDGIPPFLPKLEGVDKLEDMYKIADELAKLNYTQTQIDKIFFGNMDRIIRTILP